MVRYYQSVCAFSPSLPPFLPPSLPLSLPPSLPVAENQEAAKDSISSNDL